MSRRFRILNSGYIFDLWLMKMFFFPIFFFGLLAFGWGVTHGFNGVACYETMSCINPFYGACDDYGLCGLAVLPPGYSYDMPPRIIQNSGLPMVLLGVAYFFINHFFYNKRFTKKWFKEGVGRR